MIHRNLFDEIEVFNSLGRNPSVFSKVKNHYSTAKSFVTNSTQLKSDNSTLCGEFTIFFVVKRYYDPESASYNL